jgi:CubicO group peptidase (beta-lactamase class C family)
VVIEKLTGKSWEENMKEKILKPLAMDNTNVSTKDMEKSADHSLAYVTKDSIIKVIPYRNIDAMGPAGSINSCAKDMAQWLITWINGGKLNGKEIIPSSYVNEAMTVQMATGGGVPGAENPDIHFSGYGLGWGMASYRVDTTGWNMAVELMDLLRQPDSFPATVSGSLFLPTREEFLPASGILLQTVC